LAAAEGRSGIEIAAELGCSGSTVGRWRGRFARRGLDGLHDEPRPGKPRTIGDEDVERVIVKTLEEQPKDATQWSTRSMAAATGMSQSAVSRIWRAFGLKPHQTETFKLSPDPQFIDKVRDIVGLYLNPPEAAVVLCVDEKSQIQALDRSAPVLPLMPGVPARQSHDYVRNGTTNLYAALDLASGQLLAEMTPRQRAEEFRRFLSLIDSALPAHLDVHVVLDNSSTHKTPSLQRWLVRHPRFTLHFTPTYRGCRVKDARSVFSESKRRGWFRSAEGVGIRGLRCGRGGVSPELEQVVGGADEFPFGAAGGEAAA
jgi:transposase